MPATSKNPEETPWIGIITFLLVVGVQVAAQLKFLSTRYLEAVHAVFKPPQPRTVPSEEGVNDDDTVFATRCDYFVNLMKDRPGAENIKVSGYIGWVSTDEEAVSDPVYVFVPPIGSSISMWPGLKARVLFVSS